MILRQWNFSKNIIVDGCISSASSLITGPPKFSTRSFVSAKNGRTRNWDELRQEFDSDKTRRLDNTVTSYKSVADIMKISSRYNFCRLVNWTMNFNVDLVICWQLCINRDVNSIPLSIIVCNIVSIAVLNGNSNFFNRWRDPIVLQPFCEILAWAPFRSSSVKFVMCVNKDQLEPLICAPANDIWVNDVNCNNFNSPLSAKTACA